MDAVLARRRPDLMVLDLMLPGEDGLSVCRHLGRCRASDPDADGEERRDRSCRRSRDRRG